MWSLAPHCKIWFHPVIETALRAALSESSVSDMGSRALSKAPQFSRTTSFVHLVTV